MAPAWSATGSSPADWQDYLAIIRPRTAGIDVDVVLATFADGGKVNLRPRW